MFRTNPKPIRLITFVTDIIFINLALYIAYVMRYGSTFLQPWIRPVVTYYPYEDFLTQHLIYLGLLLITFWQHRVWRRRRGEFWADEMGRVLSAVSLATALMIVYLFVQLPEPFSRLFWVFAPLIILSLISIARIVRRTILLTLYQSGRAVDKVLLVGMGETGRSVLRTLIARPDLGFQVIGYMHNGQNSDFSVIGRRIPDLGAYDNLAHIIQANPTLHSVFIALPGEMHSEVKRLVRICRSAGVQVQVAPDLFQLSLTHVESANMGGIPILQMREINISPGELLVKRLLDFVLILILAIPALIIGLIIAIAIKLDSEGPIFYTGRRVGRHGQDFRMYKFRSMVVDAESRKEALTELNEKEGPIFKIKDDPRLTRVGKVIRRLSLDELPQLINVLRGEMSLVGPRPPLREEVDEYQAWHKQRLLVRGGITGLWQVSGRSDLTFDEQALLDIYYIENWSISLDLRILIQTIPYALFARGAY